MLPTFKKAVQITLSNWPALQFAVQQQAGGPQSAAIAEWMVGVTEQYFYDNEDLEAEEVADYLATIMDQELNTMVEDESDVEVGQCLCRFYRLCVEGSDAQVLDDLSKIPVGMPSFRVQDLCEEEEESDKPPQLVDRLGALQLAEAPPRPEPEPRTAEQLRDEAEGWTMVQRRKHK
ncbi:pre-rRNA-processing protein TSR2 homolog isoform X2 [Portunus trituberculatus]|uniref:pre-rRNA-processing protein TSR2 homolog isoform X2 n=1 Tax=Portunus trituberculatus TaxID=210409 RepID=UPI001E1CB4B6|nr:pre-rRNA-processing protein TSR2 homolog isoform X2 [Portunus trituberculatus]